MADVFISYCRRDKARVQPLVAAIEGMGWSVWWDPAIAPGQDFDRQIDAELKHAAAVLVVWTPESVASRWVRGEAREAADRDILVPVRFENAQLPIDVRAFHTIDLDNAARDPQPAGPGTARRARHPRRASTSGDGWGIREGREHPVAIARKRSRTRRRLRAALGQHRRR